MFVESELLFSVTQKKMNVQMKTMANVLKVQKGPDLTSVSGSHEGVSLI